MTSNAQAVRKAILCVAIAATGTAVSVSVLAGWQRGGWLSERVLWIAISAVLVVSAHLLPALCRAAPLAVRFMGAVLWAGCMAATCYGHATFFLAAQQHAGQIRAETIAEPPPATSMGRSLTQIADDRAAIVAELAARCSTGCTAKRIALKARLDALDVEMSEARRQEAQVDRATSQQDRATERRDELRADPVTSRVAAFVGAPVARVDLLTGLTFAAVLEGVACFCWLLTFDAAAAPEIHDEAEPMPLVTSSYPTSVKPVTVAVTANDEPAHDLAQVREAIASGRLRATVAEIRKHLGCSQSRAMAVRRQLVTGVEIV
ncbi:hypothetical protein QF000_006511 [Paraburkholderia atlantica]|uniref:hypothetical protein n=1 Tax=Paraburkholderia atlantica TaxID=2654982 RepID=UPI003D1955BA